MWQERPRSIGLIKGFLLIHLLAAALVEAVAILMWGAVMTEALHGNFNSSKGRADGPMVIATLFLVAGLPPQIRVFVNAYKVCCPLRRLRPEEVRVPPGTLRRGIGSMILSLASAGTVFLSERVIPAGWEDCLFVFLPFLSATVFIGCCFGLIHFGKRYPAFPGPL